MSLRQSFATQNEIQLGTLQFRRVDEITFKAPARFRFYDDAVIREVKALGAEAAWEDLNIVVGILDGYQVCQLTKVKPASVVAREFSFGRAYGQMDGNVAVLKEVEDQIMLRPFFATDEALFCDIGKSTPVEEIAEVIHIARHMMAPEALNDLDPFDFARKYRELRFSYSP